jgi:hypothetical protein
MADVRRNNKPTKKDQSGPREVREEVNREIQQNDVKPRVGNPNRDRARGDWDRSGVHHDEGTSRDETGD